MDLGLIVCIVRGKEDQYQYVYKNISLHTEWQKLIDM